MGAFSFLDKKSQTLNKNDFRQELYSHIIENCEEKSIFLRAIGGYSDHIHCLISLNKDQNISKVAQLIKGESTYWINDGQLIKGSFNWQDDYFAVSVSESQVEMVVNYIKGQEQHHANKSFNEEVELFMKRYGWQEMLNK